MKTLKNLLVSLNSVREVLFANEEAPKTFDFRKMVLGLLGAKDDASDAELEEMANACMKDETDYSAKMKAGDDATAKLAANEAELATVKASVTLLTTERDAANAKLSGGEARALAAEARAAKAEADFANETAKLTALEIVVKAADAKLTEATQLVANERKAFADSTLTIALESGRISAADKGAWEKDFANSADYQAVAAKLVKLPAKWKTTTSVNGLGGRSSESLSRSEKVLARVAELQAANEKDGKDASYESCFAQVKKEMSSEFAQMTQPGKTK